MDKSKLVEQLRAEVESQLNRATEAYAGAQEAATGDDTKAENKYDTRGLEASYLAAGQAELVEELTRAKTVLENFECEDFDIDDPIEQGALVECDLDGEIVFYFLAPAGGGLSLENEYGETVTVLGPASPLATKLLGKSTGAILDDPSVMVMEVM